MSKNYTAADLKAMERNARKAAKAQAKRVARDEAAERKRFAKNGFSNPANPTRSLGLTIVCAIFAIYCLFPFYYLLVNATKTQSEFMSKLFGLAPGHNPFATLWDNIVTVFTYQNGIFGRWFLNTILYVVAGAGGATFLAIMGGYALAKFRFPGRKLVFAIIIGSISVPGIALAVPQFLLFAKLNLTQSPWAMIIPSLVSTFGLYLMWIFSDQAVPDELLEAARVDGAGEFRTFFQISQPLLAPGIVTTALFTIVATWNNYFLPLIMLTGSQQWYPLTIGLNQWNDQANTAGGQAIQNLVITGSLITIIPLVIAFLLLQKYWQSGLAAGAVKE